MRVTRPSKRALPRAGRIPRFASMTDSTANTPNDPAGPWAIPVRRPLPGDDKRKSTTSFPRKVWHLLVGIKDALALIFLLRSEEHTAELQSIMRISYAVFCLKKKRT